MSTIIIFVNLGLQVKWNPISSNKFHHSSSSGVACLEVSWPNDLQTRLCQYTGLQLGRPPLEPNVHWDATGTTRADVSSQWYPSGNPGFICIIGIHWKTTGVTNTLGCQWNHTGWCQHRVASQWRSSVNLHNWNIIEDHWKHTGNTLATHDSFSSGIPVYTGV